MIPEERKFRHEFKYLISRSELAHLKMRMGSLMRRDPHVDESGQYHISSLYFDDLDNTCYFENESGTDPREKFRIRIYNGSPSSIRLECKRKERGKVLKTSCSLTRDQADLLVLGKPVPYISGQHPVLRKLTLLMMTRGMRPVVIVEYDRIPFVCSTGNVRITLDMNLTSSSDVLSFFGGAAFKRPVLQAGQHLLEVKYDEFLPDEIYRSLQLDNLMATAFSKYYLCRKYTV